MLDRLVAYIRGLATRDRANAEVDDELRFHLEMETQAHLRRGLSPTEARRAALRDLGGVTQAKEAVREVRAVWVETAWHDALYALKRMGRTRGLIAGAILTLIAGIGANSAIFSLADPMFLQSLPYPDADRIVTAEVTGPEVFGRFANAADLLLLEQEAQSVELVSTFDPGPRGYLGNAADMLTGMRVSPNLLDLLGTRPAAGRVFAREEYLRDSRVRAQVAMISWPLWHTAFGGRPDVVGSRLTLTGSAVRVSGSGITATADVADMEIVGVLPRSFVFPNAGAAPPAFVVPAGIDPSWAGIPTRGVPILARLRPGAELSHAAAELTNVCARTQLTYPSIPKVRTVRITGLQDRLFEDLRRPLLLLFAAATTLLLLAYVNLSHLMMASLRTREHEMGVRRALGAGTSRLVRLVIAEVAWVCFFAAVGGVLAGQALLGWAMSQTPEFGYVYRLLPTGIDGRDALFGAILAAIGLLVVGAWPAWRLARSASRSVGGHTLSQAHGRVREVRWLIGLQAAFTVAVLAAGALTVKSFAVLVLQSRGFDPAEIRSIPIRLPASVMSDPALTLSTYRQLVEGIARVPGVAAVTMSASLPGLLTSGSVLDEASGKPIDNIWVHRVGGGFPALAGLRLEAGRFFADDEAYGGAGVAIVDRRTADRLWPGEDPLGRRLRERNGRVSSVVGVVSTVSQTFRKGVTQPGLVLTPLAATEYTLTLAARFDGPPPMAAIRDRARQVDDRIVVGAPASHVTYERFVGQPRFLATVVGGLSALAAVLVASGVFAVASHAVLRRRRELAVRLALGATPTGVRALVLRHAVEPAVLGIGCGLTAAFWWTKGLESVLLGVHPRDWSSYVIAAALALLAITTGVVLPAARASRMNPAVTLRSE